MPVKLPFILARRFVAAESLEATLPVLRTLSAEGYYVTVDRLGEYVEDRRQALATREAYQQLIDVVAEERDAGRLRDANISLKLSALGQKIDEAFCLDNLRLLLEAARARNVFIRLDMEGSDLTASTLRIFETVYPDYPDHVGPVLQAYLKRTREDVARMCALKARVRLCKGAYKEPPALAYQDMPTIRARFIEYMQQLLLEGRYPGIATHDDYLIAATKRFAAQHQIGSDRFEFQMLYGIRPQLQHRLVHEGYRLRVYVPYGTEWLPYFYRRLRERKENVWFVLKNLFRR
jgi:proline dehydrogenase